MAPQLKLYTVLSYILIPIALFFAFMDIVLLFSSLANPSALIMVFILACLVIYTFASFKFLKAGIEKEIAQSSKFKQPDYLAPKGISLLCFTFNPVTILETMCSVDIHNFYVLFGVLCALGKAKAGTVLKPGVALNGNSG